MYRKYREGELPDIEIPNRALVAPLAAACQHDAKLARLFIPQLVSSLIKSSDRSEVRFALSLVFTFDTRFHNHS